MESSHTKIDHESRIFSVAVDNHDHKAIEFRPFSLSSPHMRAFHLAWLSLFSCFFSTFSIPPLIEIIREDLNLSEVDIGRAGIASFIGSIFSRLAMGPACDVFGPRVASATLSLLTAPTVLSTSLISSPQGFILVRFLIGFCLANFVANQFWMSSMFSGCVVGLANGFAAGWANVGSGATQLAMPLIYSLFTNFYNVPSFISWRIAFIFPAIFQAVTAILVLVYGQDLPDGYYKRKKMSKPSENIFSILFNGLKNYRGWILGLTYGFCFGVELTMDNIIAQYFYDRFHVNIDIAGAIAASFGLGNCLSRPIGGILSDKMGKRFGMRGRLWSLWIVQTVAGLLCVLLGRVNTTGISFMIMACFSLFVQAASGLTFGIVPFVSKRFAPGLSSSRCSGAKTTSAVRVSQLLFRMATSLLVIISVAVCSLQEVIRCNIGHDWKWWDFRSSDDTATSILRFHQILNGNQHIYHGTNDARLYSTNYPYILPEVGWNVLWLFN